jgi:cytochrome c oxidase subunit 2
MDYNNLKLTLNVFALGFQDSATPVMEGIVDFHNHICFFLVMILIFVFWILGNVVYFFLYTVGSPTNSKGVLFREVIFPLRDVTHGALLEIIWTIIPSVILMLIAIPSFALLYSMDEVIGPSITFKVVGHQWYWSYEYSDYTYIDDNGEVAGNINFDSYMVPETSLKLGDFRLLEVDNHLVVPVKTHIRVIITAADVLHSWSVNALGVKVDAVPGRLNQTSLYIKRQGVYYGQCSEICGVNHGFMPIVIKAVSFDDYKSWILSR